MRRLLRFAGGDVQLAPDWPEEHPSGVTPTTLLDAFDDAPEDTDVLSPLALDEILSEVAP